MKINLCGEAIGDKQDSFYGCLSTQECPSDSRVSTNFGSKELNSKITRFYLRMLVKLKIHIMLETKNNHWKHFKLFAKHDLSKHLNTQPRSYLLMHGNSKIHIWSNTKNNLWVGATGHTT